LNHPVREAAARCLSCQNYFCRECVTEHRGRLICTKCLAILSAAAPARKSSLRWLVSGLSAAAALLLLWFGFYLVGRLLLTIPSSFHEATWLEQL
jgi:hypothetical protein